MKKRIVSILLVTSAISSALLTGCGGKEATDNASESSTAVENTTVESTATESTAVEASTAAEAATESATEGSSYNEIIDSLEAGNAYAYINVNGYDGDILAVADFAYDLEPEKNVAISATLYADVDGKAELIGEVLTGDTANPLRCADGVLYVCNIKQYAQMEIQQTSDGSYELYYTQCANIIDNEDGSATVETSGDINVTDADEVYDMIGSVADIPAIEFEVVK